MKFFFAAIYAVAAVLVSGQEYTGPVYITSPLAGTVYNAGSPAVINWINPVSNIITKIILAQGSATNIQPLITIAENVDATHGSYSWDIPADFLPGNDFAFILGTAPNVTYSGQFTVNNANAAPVSSSAASSATAVTPAASAASGSASGSASSSATATAPSSTSAGNLNKAAFGGVAIAGVAVMALI